MNELRRRLLLLPKQDLLELISKLDSILISCNGLYDEHSLYKMLPKYKFKEDIRLPIIKDKQ